MDDAHVVLVYRSAGLTDSRGKEIMRKLREEIQTDKTCIDG